MKYEGFNYVIICSHCNEENSIWADSNRICICRECSSELSYKEVIEMIIEKEEKQCK